MDYRLKDSPEHLGFLEYLYERYKALIVSKPILKPLTKETKVLDELLKRGFVRNSDHRFEKGSYVIEATQFGMVYPRNFIARKTVRVYLKKFSLVNYCTIIKI